LEVGQYLASSSSKEAPPSVDEKLIQLRSEPAIIFEKPEEEVSLIKHKDGLYNPVTTVAGV
jgi:hypothetical protein